MRLLLVEDDATLGKTLSERLSKEGYNMELARSFNEAKLKIEQAMFDLVIFDVGLPDGNGFDGARVLKNHANTPFLFVTAQSDAQTRLEAFELGAEEVIPKPFHLKELILRIEHVLENHRPTQCIKYEGFTVDIEAHRIQFAGGDVIDIPVRDFEILKLLIKKSPAVVSRDDILNVVWGEETFPSSRTVDNSIVRLRQSLKDYAHYLVSVRGVGYQWKEKEN